jgi:hypothetical protein
MHPASPHRGLSDGSIIRLYKILHYIVNFVSAKEDFNHHLDRVSYKNFALSSMSITWFVGTMGEAAC